MEQIKAQYPDQTWSADIDLSDWSTLCGVREALEDVNKGLNLSHDPPILQPETTASDGGPPSSLQTRARPMQRSSMSWSGRGVAILHRRSRTRFGQRRNLSK